MPSRNAQKAAIPKATSFSFALYAWASLGLAQPKPGQLSTHNRRCAELNWEMLMCATFSACLLACLLDFHSADKKPPFAQHDVSFALGPFSNSSISQIEKPYDAMESRIVPIAEGPDASQCPVPFVGPESL
ncbi:hypothetical protein F4803DRAFT_552263 [Xylaria telfairii]|nr:hypothetical protein F4803DRAFT_552263 [Xylaria telfairii]